MDFGVIDIQTQHYVGGLLSRDTTAASSTVIVTGIGFRPKAMQSFVADLSGIDQRCHTAFLPQEGASNAQGMYNHRAGVVGNWFQNDQIATWVTSSGNSVGGVITSFDADGFTLDWTKVGSPTANTFAFRYICYR
jgi:hypothetical protein